MKKSWLAAAIGAGALFGLVSYGLVVGRAESETPSLGAPVSLVEEERAGPGTAVNITPGPALPTAPAASSAVPVDVASASTASAPSPAGKGKPPGSAAGNPKPPPTKKKEPPLSSQNAFEYQ